MIKTYIYLSSFFLITYSLCASVEYKEWNDLDPAECHNKIQTVINELTLKRYYAYRNSNIEELKRLDMLIQKLNEVDSELDTQVCPCQ